MVPPSSPIRGHRMMASPEQHKALAVAGGGGAAARMPPPIPTKTSFTEQQELPPTFPRSAGAKRALPGTKSKSRGKRAKPADNRSTVTTTTDTARTPVNVYDAVLGEAEDLLQAAFEAQALGRLKMASAYQLLLHARLVGLGKRFDRAEVLGRPDPNQEDTAVTTAAEKTGSNLSEGKGTARDAKSMAPADSAQKETTLEDKSSAKAAAAAMEGLAKYLPDDVQIDSQMMEHLARVAMELHHQKTGRKIQSDLGAPSPAIAAASAAAAANNNKSTVAWNEQEKHQCQELLDQGLSEHDIAQQMKSRSEQQVRAYLANQKQRAKEVRVIEQDFEVDTPRKKGRGRKPPTQAMNTVPNANLDARRLLSGKGLD